MEPFVHEGPPSRIVFGSGKVTVVSDEIDALPASRAILISNRSSRPAAERVRAALEERVVSWVGEVRQHVPEEDAIRARRLVEETRGDVLVAVGGGSAIGLAKAAAVVTDLPIVCVPTTYSGSEMTPVYGTSSEGVKRTGSDPVVLPRTVIYDPTLTFDLSPEATAASGMNAIAHCVEALYAEGRTPLIEIVATEGLRDLVRGLPASLREPKGLEGRAMALYGAYLAGSVLTGAGMALHHTICHVLGGRGFPHGELNAVLLPHVLAFNAPAAPDAVRRVGDVFGSDDGASALFDFARSLGAPAGLRELGVERDSLDEVARAAVESLKWNPRAVTKSDVVGILAAAYDGERPG